MCWNANVSLNTFLFSSFMLGLIMYNNYYTQYKIAEFRNIWCYLFCMSFIFMQLIEFFIWKNLDNTFLNTVFSSAAVILLSLQPVVSLMLLSNIKLRNILVGIYIFLAIPFLMYTFGTKNVFSKKSKNGHLRWVSFEGMHIPFLVYLFFFLFSFMYEKQYFGIIFGMVTLFISYINYNHNRTMGSMWCWIVNSVMVYYAFYLLIYLPFSEKKKLCG